MSDITCPIPESAIAAELARQDREATPEQAIAGLKTLVRHYHEGKISVKTGTSEPGVLKSAFFPWFIQREYRIEVPAGMTIRRTAKENEVEELKNAA